MATNTKGVYYAANTDAAITVEAQSLATANSVPVNPNYAINGGFDIWQRSVGPVSAGNGAYAAADRWYIYNGAVQTTTVAKETTIVPSGFNSSIKLTQTGTVASVYIMQSVETLNTAYLAGKTVTLSAYVYGTVSTTFAVQLVADTATDKTPSSGYASTVAATTQAVGATWTRVSATGVVPVGTKTVRIDIYASSLALSQPVYFAGVQLEEGSVATTFRRSQPTLQAELAACQRYCYVKNGSTTDSLWGWGRWEGNNFYCVLQHPVQMRVPPTFTLNNVSGLQVVDPTIAWYSVQSINAIHKGGTYASDVLFNIAGASVGNKTFGILAVNSGTPQLIVSAEL